MHFNTAIVVLPSKKGVLSGSVVDIFGESPKQYACTGKRAYIKH